MAVARVKIRAGSQTLYFGGITSGDSCVQAGICGDFLSARWDLCLRGDRPKEIGCSEKSQPGSTASHLMLRFML
jgi:hypothetical protein